MEFLIAGAILVLAILIPALIPPRRPGKKARRIASSFGVFNEIFHPEAVKALEVIEEQAEAVKPMPSPEDKKR